MEPGLSNGGAAGKGRKGGGARANPGPWPSRIEPFVPKTDHNPRDLESWAKRTGFNPNLSGKTASSGAAPARPAPQPPSVPVDAAGPDGRLRRSRSPPELEIEPILGRRNGRGEINAGNSGSEDARRVGRNEVGDERVLRPKNDVLNGNGRGNGGQVVETEAGAGEDAKHDLEKGEMEVDFEYADRPSGHRPAGLKCGLTENPGYGRLVFYGLQHYLSLAGSLVFIPLVMVPAMGGTDKDTATVISTMLLVTGVTTILHTFFGTRLPLVQGSSFVYLAPAMVIINSEEFRNLSENKFKHIMRELQGAIIIGSVFQITMGYSGLISLLLRFINPVVVAPTIAAVGLAFFSYGFPQAGTCVGISIPLILLVLIFTLYLRKISIFGHRIFLVYAVPLSVAIVWAYAFFLTAGGAYSYKSCNSNIPSSNILLATCRKHAETMKHCRTDASSAWRTAAWVRVPYPFQWGSPIFHFKTSIVMIITSLVASVESVGVYHASSLLISLSPPTPGVVSRGIGLEGCSSLLAGLWGTGTGSSTLTENLNAIDVTKMASRKALQLGAVFLIFFSFVGKVGALLASVPLALAAAVLCFAWALIVALGLSTLQYSQAASSRNIIIIGFTLFTSLSIPAYFQQYQPNSSLILPSYLLPYAAGSSGPVQTGSEGFDFALNSLLSLNMVVALIISFVLDNTVPGNRQERGVYIWSSSTNPDIDPSSLEPYFLPQKIGGFFRWAKCVGA